MRTGEEELLHAGEPVAHAEVVNPRPPRGSRSAGGNEGEWALRIGTPVSVWWADERTWDRVREKG